jgi:O-antigen/teichoic acid export membrane protein
MSPLKKNVVAMYASQIIMTFISLVMLPIYVRYLGLEAYGLVGVFVMLQGWFTLLDFGLSATVLREAARHRAGANSASQMRNLLLALEIVFLGIALAVTLILTLESKWLAAHWLRVETLSLTTVQLAIVLMAPALAMRFLSGLFRSLVNGFEDLVWLGSFNVAIAVMRFAAVIPAFVLFGGTPIVFFIVQVVVAALELIILLKRAYRHIPGIPDLRIDLSALRPLLGFSLAAAFVGAVWVVVTQIDKLLLSAILPLSEYAIFSLVGMAANGLLIISTPISGALAPRLMSLHAKGDNGGLVSLYRRASQLTAATAVPLAILMAMFSRELLWAWTGDMRVTSQGAPVLGLYAAGTGLLTVSSYAAYLQYAHGTLRLHVIGNILFLLLLVPLMAILATTYGAVGAGIAWLTLNAAYLLLWVPIVHRHFLPSLHWRWLLQDIGLVALPALALAFLLRVELRFPPDRLLVGLLLGAIGVALVGVSGLASNWLRTTAANQHPNW